MELPRKDWIFLTAALLAIPITASGVGALEIFVK